MDTLIDWLRDIELSAANLYRDAAEFFREDESFSRFLRSLAEDEIYHYRVMGLAYDSLGGSGEEIRSEIALDRVTREKIEGAFARGVSYCFVTSHPPFRVSRKGRSGPKMTVILYI